MWPLMCNSIIQNNIKNSVQGFPVTAVKNPPANAGDVGSILMREDPRAAGQLSPCATTGSLCTLEPVLRSKKKQLQ